MDWDDELDAQGLLCPLPVLKARKRLMSMAPGAVLRVVATDRASVIDMPHFCTQEGHTYLGCDEMGDTLAHIIRRGEARPA
ncbi:sulfurtransferase TusA family protein [Rhodobacter sp. NTK016B]|uniref:sulfurtransferase TusA family protein n=1 Tax=Rhodobacter sp. NTK016B TaxID=2759676 RepID=UPI001A904085|nr:sulfurtransferase TusA family protein [Rhodobacter sp. NTK016B]MBN8290702.1 sulfurtransferase TusA family protein [Rhodobacter sp. NTK016B]